MNDVINQNRVGLCKLIAQALMPNDADISTDNEVHFKYTAFDATNDNKRFKANLIVRFKANEIEVQTETDQRQINTVFYKKSSSADKKNSKLVEKIFNDFADFDSDYITALQSIVIAYFAH